MLSEALVFMAAIAAAYATSLFVIPIASRIGFVAGFNPIVPQERPPAALGGGVGILVGLMAGIGVAEWGGLASTGSMGIAIAVMPALLVGLVDDARPMSPRQKLCLQFAAAAAGLAMADGVPKDISSGLFYAGAVFGAVVLMNAFNFLDVSDGYAGGIAAVSFAGLALFTPENAIAIAALGACIGFLGFNLPPARIYMGDAGSHCLGMLVAIQIFVWSRDVGMLTAVGVGVACFGVALLELAAVTAIRWRKGLSIWRGSPDHSALRLQQAGLSKTWTLLAACALQATLICGYWLARQAAGAGMG